MPRETLIIGCGYVGLPLALALKAKGDAVTAWVRSTATAAALAPHGFSGNVTGSVGNAAIWLRVGRGYQLVIHCASTGGGDEAAYEEVFLRGAREMNTHLPRARKIFVSSTSVYGQTDGAVVDEQSPTVASTATSRILREAEQAALEGGALVVRPAGIYGPGRTALIERVRRGDATIEGDGKRWTNHIHRDDLVAALLHLIEAGRPGEIYNICDDTSVTQLDYYAWCAELVGKPLPPFGPANPNRKRGLTNKRVSNAKLRATGWAPQYPSFREGIAEACKNAASSRDHVV